MYFSVILQVLKDEIILQNLKNTEKEFTSLAYDSRKVQKDGIFVCLPGARANGHNFIEDCIKKDVGIIVVSEKSAFEKYCNIASLVLVKDTRKALALISAEFFGNPAEKLNIIGITGTKGKTSTSYMIKSILENARFSVGVIGTVGIFYAGKEEYIDNSTPESYELHRIFADMLSCGITHVVMEVSSQALMMHRTYGIKFTVGVFTNLSPDHIGENEHTDFEQYRSCKALLFSQCKKAVVNIDSEHSDYFVNVIKTSGSEPVTYSTKNADADFYGYNAKFYMQDSLHTTFELKGKGELNINIPGQFSVYNALCACAVCDIFGATYDDFSCGLEKVCVLGRVEQVKHEKCTFPIIIDYAHNALSLESLFSSIFEYKPKNIYCVFGCGGNRSKLRRYDMGEISGKYASLSIITSDNPRFEKVEDIIDDILVGIKKTDGKYLVIKDRRKAIFEALSLASKNDIVLIVGKGNQKYEEIEDKKIPFDEREVVKEYYDNEL